MDETSDNTIVMSNKEREDQQDDGDESQLPGFRFYPTDEELVNFYLRRKVESRPFSIDLIRETDIYKYDPWDLPKTSTVGDNEWYFFCKRGRKYRNSVRPNRVTGSGFWKATGIDKPIRSTNNRIVGLKKSLVYYTGNAGKGTKTDWMMHEFRLPAHMDFITHNSPPSVIASASSNDTLEAEVWTVCRIFKRNVPSRKYTSNWREISTKSRSNSSAEAYISRSVPNNDNDNDNNKNKSTIKGENYISFNNVGTSSRQQITHLTDQNHDISASIVSQYDRTSTPATTRTVFSGHEQCRTSNYNSGSLNSTTMAAMTPPFPNSQPHYNTSVTDPMDITCQQENTTDQFVTTESWDELRKLWSFFQE